MLDTPLDCLANTRRIRRQGILTIVPHDGGTDLLVFSASNGQEYVVEQNELWSALRKRLNQFIEVTGLLFVDNLGNHSITVLAFEQCERDDEIKYA